MLLVHGGSPKVMDGYAGWGSVMEIDANDDIFIVSNAPNNLAIKLTTIQGSGHEPDCLTDLRYLSATA